MFASNIVMRMNAGQAASAILYSDYVYDRTISFPLDIGFGLLYAFTGTLESPGAGVSWGHLPEDE